MKALLAIYLAASLAPGGAFGYGGSYTNIELQRSKKKTAQQSRRVAPRSATGDIVTQPFGTSASSSGGSASSTGAGAGAGGSGSFAKGSFTSLGQSSLGCPSAFHKDATGKCVADAAAPAPTLGQAAAAAAPGGAAATPAGAAGAGSTGATASAATTGTTASPSSYGSAPGYGASGISPTSAATQSVKQ